MPRAATTRPAAAVRMTTGSAAPAASSYSPAGVVDAVHPEEERVQLGSEQRPPFLVPPERRVLIAQVTGERGHVVEDQRGLCGNQGRGTSENINGKLVVNSPARDERRDRSTLVGRAALLLDPDAGPRLDLGILLLISGEVPSVAPRAASARADARA